MIAYIRMHVLAAALLSFSLAFGSPAHAQEVTRTIEEARRIVNEAIEIAKSKPTHVQEKLLSDIFLAYSAVGDFGNALRWSANALIGPIRALDPILTDVYRQEGSERARAFIEGRALSSNERAKLQELLNLNIGMRMSADEGLATLPKAWHSQFLQGKLSEALRSGDATAAQLVATVMANTNDQLIRYLGILALARQGYRRRALDYAAKLVGRDFYIVVGQIGIFSLEKNDNEIARRAAELLVIPPESVGSVDFLGSFSTMGKRPSGSSSVWPDEWIYGKGPEYTRIFIADGGPATDVPLMFASALNFAGEITLARQITDLFRAHAKAIAQESEGKVKQFPFGPTGSYLVRVVTTLATIGQDDDVIELAAKLPISTDWHFDLLGEMFGETGNTRLLEWYLRRVPTTRLNEFIVHAYYGLLIGSKIEYARKWAARYAIEVPASLVVSAAFHHAEADRSLLASRILDMLEAGEIRLGELPPSAWATIGDGRKQLGDRNGAARAYRRAFQSFIDNPSINDIFVKYPGWRPTYDGIISRMPESTVSYAGWLAAYLICQLQNLDEAISVEGGGALIKNQSVRQRYFEVAAEFALMNGKFEEAERYQGNIWDNRDSLDTPPNAAVLISLEEKHILALAGNGFLSKAIQRVSSAQDHYGLTVSLWRVVDAWSRWRYRQLDSQRKN